MLTVEGLAETYGLTTADKIIVPMRKKLPDGVPELATEWSREKRALFRDEGFAALCIVATDGPVSVTLYDRDGAVTRRIGHNRGVWPMRTARQGGLKDGPSATYGRNPLVPLHTQIRMWTLSDVHARRLALPVSELLGQMSEEAMGTEIGAGCVDVGPEVDLGILEAEIHAIAERLRIPTWSDKSLSIWLDRKLEERKALS